MGFLDSLGDVAGQVGGVFKGAGEALWETGKGVVDLGVGVATTAYDISPAGLATSAATRFYEGATGNELELPEWLPSADRGADRLAAAAGVVGTIADDPGLLVDAIVDPIVDDWNNGNYGEAIGRGAIEVLGVVVGTKGVDKVGRTARIADAAGDAGRATRAADAAGDLARAGRATDEAADAGGVVRQADRAADAGHGLSRTQIDDIRAIEKGSRPDPSEYLSQSYITEHLTKFEGGATRFQLRSRLDRYGPGQRDGTSFVMPKDEADRLLASTGGDPRALERALGLPEGQLDGPDALMRIDFVDPQELNLRLPSGNEVGANDNWIPGGKLPNGNSEAVIDVGGIPESRYRVTSVAVE